VLSAEGTDAIAYRCPACGEFTIDTVTAATLMQVWAGKRFRLSAATRKASDSGRSVRIDAQTIESLLETAPPAKTLVELMDRFLTLASQRVNGYLDPFVINARFDFPLLVARDEHEMNRVWNLCQEEGYMTKVQLRLKGWGRIEALRKAQPDSRRAFVAMSFAADLMEAYSLGIKPGIEDTKYFTALRLDQVQHNDKIDDRILADIRRSGLVVADFTNDRGSVYFEAGYALGLGIPVIWTCRADYLEKIQFDTRQYNYIAWNSATELKQRLSDRIAATVLPRPSANGLAVPT
jgi:nucleoside 2-deoxyribosyltransferase